MHVLTRNGSQNLFTLQDFFPREASTSPPTTPPPPLPCTPPLDLSSSSPPPPLHSTPPPDIIPFIPPPDFTDYKESNKFYYTEEGDGASLDLDLLAKGGDEGDIVSVDPDYNKKMMCVKELEPVYTVVQGNDLINHNGFLFNIRWQHEAFGQESYLYVITKLIIFTDKTWIS